LPQPKRNFVQPRAQPIEIGATQCRKKTILDAMVPRQHGASQSSRPDKADSEGGGPLFDLELFKNENEGERSLAWVVHHKSAMLRDRSLRRL
jgi:hypothetical protein